MKTTLTEKEHEVLALLVNAAGPLYHCTHGNINTPDSYFLSRGMKTVRSTSVWKLEKLGFIENKTDPGWRWRGSKYEITPAGVAIVDAKLRQVKDELDRKQHVG